MWKALAISGLLTFSLAGCGGSSAGLFCDVYAPVIMSDATAQVVVRDDRPAAVAIAANEMFYRTQCRG